MKKIKFLLGAFLSMLAINASAQDSKTEVKPVTTTGDKIHNVVHPNNKRYSGVKYKHKNAHYKRTVKVKKGEVKTETKKED